MKKSNFRLICCVYAVIIINDLKERNDSDNKMKEDTLLDFQNAVRRLPSMYLNNSKVLQMNCYIQHGHITTYQHCINVMVISFAIARAFKLFGFHIDLPALLIGALLHDFYLYDWHDGRMRPEGLHGFSHPLVAKENAEKYFNVNPKILNIIESHMFPMTINHLPKSKEAVIVGIADKYCAIKETLHPTKGWFAATNISL